MLARIRKISTRLLLLTVIYVGFVPTLAQAQTPDRPRPDQAALELGPTPPPMASSEHQPNVALPAALQPPATASGEVVV